MNKPAWHIKQPWINSCKPGTGREISDTPQSTRDTTSVSLSERDSNKYALVCVGPDVQSSHQRDLTNQCLTSYYCDPYGRKSYETKDDHCSAQCGCVHVRPICFPNTVSPKPLAWINCKNGKATSAELDSTSASDAGISTPEKRSESSTDLTGPGLPHTLQRRFGNDFALVCDHPNIRPEYQREQTAECAKDKGWFCNSLGDRRYRIYSTLCALACRCVNINPNCQVRSITKPKDVRFGWISCGISGDKRGFASVPEPLSIDSPIELRDLQDGLVSINAGPATIPTMNCSGNATLGQQCSDNYYCASSGLIRFADANRLDDCEQGCGCVNLPDDYSQNLDADSQSPPPGHPIYLKIWMMWCSDYATINDNFVDDQCKALGYHCGNDGIIIYSQTVDRCIDNCFCIRELADTSWRRTTSDSDVNSDAFVPHVEQRPNAVRRQSPVPTITPVVSLGPWKMWCSDADSIDDAGVTGSCQKDSGYSCNKKGKITRPKQIDSCEYACFCIQDITGYPDGGFGEQQSDVDVVKRESDPPLGPWIPWCGDDDSIRDPWLTARCYNIAHYSCTDGGDIIRPAEDNPCEVECSCVQETPFPPTQPKSTFSSSDESLWNTLNTPPSGAGSVDARAASADYQADSQSQTETDAETSGNHPKHNPDITNDSPFSQSEWGKRRANIEQQDATSPSLRQDQVEEERGHTTIVEADSAAPKMKNCQKWLVECCDFPIGRFTKIRPLTTECRTYTECSNEGDYVRKDHKDMENNDCTALCGCKLNYYQEEVCDDDDALPNWGKDYEPFAPKNCKAY